MKKFNYSILFLVLLVFGLCLSSYSQTFTEQTSISLPAVWTGSVTWFDYDNDGYLDFIITGSTSSTLLSKLYRNNGNNSFTLQTSISFTGVCSSSVACADYNNDGYVDLLITGYTGSTHVSMLYKNNGNGTFTEQTAISITGITGSVDWYDYNNDGYIDFLLTGTTGASRVSKIYKNNGDNSFTEQTNISLTPVDGSSGAWCDYDNDGYADILLTGYTGTASVSKIYKNNGNGNFTEQTAISLTSVKWGSVAWGDYNNDGYPDILLTGYNGPGQVSKIYANNGNNTFTEQTGILLFGMYNSSVAWGDLDNDGNLDMILTGYGSSIYMYNSLIYHNNGNNTFTLLSSVSLTGVNNSSVALADYDNDNDLDILLTGDDGSSFYSMIYRNNISTPNTAPSAPGGLSASVAGTQYTFSWGDATDSQTPAQSLTYNLRIGITPGGNEIMSSMSDNSNGFRRVPKPGNCGMTNSKTISIPTGYCYWSVQAVDNNFKGSPFSPEQLIGSGCTYVVNHVTCNSGNNGAIHLTVAGGTSPYHFIWSNGATTENITGLTAGSYSVTVTDANSVQISVYPVCPIIITQPSAITVFNTMVATNTGNDGAISLTVTGGTSPYSYAWSNGATSQNLSSLAAGNYQVTITDAHGCISISIINVSLEQFNVVSGISLSGYGDNSVAWGDYNNDGYLDVIVSYTGSYAHIYKNNGNGTFTNQTGIGIGGVDNGTIAWGDYNNDGYLDLLYAAGTGSGIYKNNGNNTFTYQSSITLQNVNYGNGSWGDYDNDGYLDILLTGNGLTRVYKNNGNNTFTWQSSLSFINCTGRSAWVDYDNDGYLDIFIPGANIPNGISKIYKNNGNGTFTDQTGISLPGIMMGSVAWSDYNNDGFLDIAIMSGDFGSGILPTRIFKNNGNNTFTEQTSISIGSNRYGTVAWGDYNNDGYTDLLVSGDYPAKIYKNNGNNSFTVISGFPSNMSPGYTCSWGDYDNDGDLDIVMYNHIIRNDGSVLNNPPGPPTNFNSVLNGNALTMSWNDGTDVETGTGELTYNLRIGTTPGGNEIMSAMSDLTTGFRRIPAPGNVGLRNSFTLTGLSPGTYYWSVQSVDQAYAGSVFTSTQVVHFYGMTYTTTNVSCFGGSNGAIDITVAGGNTSSGPYLYHWSNNATTQDLTGIGAGVYHVTVTDNSLATITASITIFPPDILSISAVSTVVTTVSDGTANVIVTGGTSPFSYHWSNGATTQSINGLNNGIYQVTVTDFCGQSSSVSDTVGILPFTLQTGITLTGIYDGSAEWADFNNDGCLDISVVGGLGPGYGAKIYKNNGNSTFTELTSISLTHVQNSCSNWADYDNDGNMDILVAGDPGSAYISRIFRNNGSGNFVWQSGISITGVTQGSVDWGDYNNDGYVDFVITGLSSTSRISTIYKNNGNNSFTPQTNISLTGVNLSSVAWADYNKDGFLDLLLMGYTGSSRVSKIYKNNGDGSFTEQTGISLTGITTGTAVWGDYDNDGYPDILLTGYDGNNNISKIYKNNGNNNFVLQTGISLTGVYQSSAAWGDYDNDGDLDILIAGDTGSGFITQIFTNNGNNSFSLLTTVSLVGVDYSSVAWGDYDNDGDLDVLISGDHNATKTKIYRNNIITANTAPSAPSSLFTFKNGTDVTFYWSNGSDLQTPTAGLTYNLRIGTSPGSSDILSANSNVSTGFRRIPAFGNAQYNNSWKIKGLNSGPYYWSVQTIDNGFKGSAFSTEHILNMINVSATVNNVTCYAGNDGSVNLSMTGGATPYIFHWSDGATTQNRTSLATGTYTVTVTDNQSNSVISSYILTQLSSVISVSLSGTNVNCYSQTTGSVNISVTGGITPYSYLWSNGAVTGDILQVPAGDYYMTVTDNYSCTHTASYTITQPPSPVSSSYIVTDVDCFGSSTGAIVQTATGGIAPYSFLWSDGSTGLSLSNISTGSYSFTITDANNCQDTGTVVVMQPPQITILPAIDYPSVSNNNSGQINLFVSGGNSPYNYLWSNGLTTEFADSLGTGNYSVTVSDINGCTTSGSYNLVYAVSQVINLTQGWNIFSTYIIPVNPAIEIVMSAIVSNIMIVKSGQGQVYWPQFSVNQIGNMVIGQGYQMKILVADTLVIYGSAATPENTDINLSLGWNMIGYLRQTNAPVVDMMSPIVSVISIIKDGLGHVYWPVYGVNSIGNMIPGRGYQLKITSACTFIYPPNSSNFNKSEIFIPELQHFRKPLNTGNNMTLGITIRLRRNELRFKNSEIGVFDSNGLLVGSSVINSGFAAITLWGDDELTPEKDGLVEGEEFVLKLWNSESQKEMQIIVNDWLEGDGLYTMNGISVAGVVTYEQSTTGISLTLFPNPVKEELNLLFSGVKDNIGLNIYNATGQLVYSEQLKSIPASHITKVNMSPFPGGIYFLKANVNDSEMIVKKFVK
ncbi:MAG: FG-GAP-like repeat-containing protein [Bacteroidia bacterium]|nr:FG-GAP-like repeat-containing protein [Bacteroidia bacterium]